MTNTLLNYFDVKITKKNTSSSHFDSSYPEIFITSKPDIIVYTDGACSGNPGPGGWGYVILNNGIMKSSSGNESLTTNNRMELTAAIEALKSIDSDEPIALHTDSTYLQKGISDWIFNWKKNNWITSSKKAVSNKDLWILSE